MSVGLFSVVAPPELHWVRLSRNGAELTLTPSSSAIYTSYQNLTITFKGETRSIKLTMHQLFDRPTSTRTEGRSTFDFASPEEQIQGLKVPFDRG